MDIVLASRNQKKIRELQYLLSSLSDVNILSLDDIGYHDDTEENGTTFEENSIIKAAVPAKLGYIGVADDSGLCVDALNGAPGIFSARYSGEKATDLSNNEKLISDLNSLGSVDRSASFVCSVACVFPCDFPKFSVRSDAKDYTDAFSHTDKGMQTFVMKGSVGGLIVDDPRGCDGFGYDPHFFVPAEGKTFAELSHEEKNAISHRGIAMRKFADFISEVLKGIKC